MRFGRAAIVLWCLMVAGNLFGQEAKPPQTLEGALASKFTCPAGASDSGQGPAPGIVVRWCDIKRDGRLLYHGPVWRWYRNGQLDGKEYYVYGDAEGVWPSYYENGKMSSLGEFRKGSKHGLWKYWSETGSLREEVTYGEDGNRSTEYYPSGTKKDEGTWVTSGKIGKWIYWGEDGKKKAECDFGSGVYGVSSAGCRRIADDLEPKGFSPPIPVAKRGADGSVVLSVGPEILRLDTPIGWVADTNAGRKEQLPLVFYPNGKTWKAEGINGYLRVVIRNGKSFDEVVKAEGSDFEDSVAEYRESSTQKNRLSDGRTYLLKSISYKPLIGTDSPFSIVASNEIHEQIAYIDASEKFVLMLVFAADSEQGLQEAMPNFQSVLKSMR